MSLKAYQDGMDAADHSAQYRERGSGFACKAHDKKWYKKAYFAILDFMVLNAFFAWNMSVVDPFNRHAPLPINHHELMQCAICKLEENWIDNAGIPKEFGAGS